MYVWGRHVHMSVGTWLYAGTAVPGNCKCMLVHVEAGSDG